MAVVTKVGRSETCAPREVPRPYLGHESRLQSTRYTCCLLATEAQTLIYHLTWAVSIRIRRVVNRGEQYIHKKLMVEQCCCRLTPALEFRSNLENPESL